MSSASVSKSLAEGITPHESILSLRTVRWTLVLYTSLLGTSLVCLVAVVVSL